MNAIDIGDAHAYATELFVIPDHYEEAVSSVMIPHGLIQDRIAKLANEIVASADSDQLTCVCVLKGGHQFFADLTSAMKKVRRADGRSLQLLVEFIRVSSYQGTESSGSLKLIGLNSPDAFSGKNILLVEDIVDTGLTLTRLLAETRKMGAKSTKVVSLLVKKTPRSNGYWPDFAGFKIPDSFVVGYCLDYNEHFRDLDHICVISERGKIEFAEES